MKILSALPSLILPLDKGEMSRALSEVEGSRDRGGHGQKVAGFTLIETLVTLSISAIILIVLSAVFSTYFKTYGKKAASTNISELKRSILTGILDDLRFSSSLEVNSNKISFSKANSAIKYEYKSGKVKKTINKYSNYLSEAGQINNLAFAKVKYNLINVVVDPLSAEVAIRNE